MDCQVIAAAAAGREETPGNLCCRSHLVSQDSWLSAGRDCPGRVGRALFIGAAESRPGLLKARQRTASFDCGVHNFGWPVLPLKSKPLRCLANDLCQFGQRPNLRRKRKCSDQADLERTRARYSLRSEGCNRVGRPLPASLALSDIRRAGCRKFSQCPIFD